MMRLTKIEPETARAIRSIKRFFGRQSWWCGGPIPKSALLTAKHVKMVGRVSLVRAIDIAYPAIARTPKLARCKYKKDRDVKLVIDIIHQCEGMGIPQYHIGGLLLLYLKLCEKVEW